MVEEQATVIGLEGDFVWLQTHRQSSCGHCSAKNGCGTQVLSKVVGNKTTHIRCYNSKNLKKGDRVIVGIEESVLLTGSFLIYFLPLVSMIILGAIGTYLSKTWWPEGSDLMAIIGSALGLIFGLFVSRQLTRNTNSRHFEPVILKKVHLNEMAFQPAKWNKS